MAAPVMVSPSASTALAMPKSVTTAHPSSSSMTFPGFTSR